MTYDWKKEDLEGMKNPSPEKWPVYPILPMKNYELKERGSPPVLGVIMALDPKPTIYLAPLYELGVEQFTTEMDSSPNSLELHAQISPQAVAELRSKLEPYQKQEFESFEAMQAAGWCVD